MFLQGVELSWQLLIMKELLRVCEYACMCIFLRLYVQQPPSTPPPILSTHRTNFKAVDACQGSSVCVCQCVVIAAFLLLYSMRVLCTALLAQHSHSTRTAQTRIFCAHLYMAPSAVQESR